MSSDQPVFVLGAYRLKMGRAKDCALYERYSYQRYVNQTGENVTVAYDMILGVADCQSTKRPFICMSACTVRCQPCILCKEQGKCGVFCF